MVSFITTVIVPLLPGSISCERAESVKFTLTEATKHAPQSSDKNEILVDVTILLLRFNARCGQMTRMLQAARSRSSHISDTLRPTLDYFTIFGVVKSI